MPTALNNTFGPLETDTDTGLPKLPQGLAWRVSRCGPESSSVKVSVSQLPNGTAIYGDFYMITHPSSDALKNATKMIYGRIREFQAEQVKVNDLVGLYPPNAI